MPIEPDQEVFPFLADDPLYQAAVVQERVVRDLLERVSPEMEQRISKILWEERIGPAIEGRIDSRMQELDDHIEELVGQRIEEAIRSIKDVVVNIVKVIDDHLDNQRHTHDSADWWKHGGNPPGGGDDEQEAPQ